MGTGVDRSYGFSDSELQCLANSGVTAVGRYYSTNSSKRLTSAEAIRIAQAGLEIFTVYQNSNNVYSYFSYNQGYSDATDALSQGRAAGQHFAAPIYFGVDFEATSAQLSANVLNYFNGIQQYLRDYAANNNGSKYPIGVYGSYNTVNYIYQNVTDVLYKWQTASWSYGQKSNYNIYQNQFQTGYGTCIQAGSSGVDINDLSTNYGGWYAGQ
jgi:hypothetical protein